MLSDASIFAFALQQEAVNAHRDKAVEACPVSS